MPKNPKTGEKRPADLNKLAAFIVGLATGTLKAEKPVSQVKRKAGIKGGEVRTTSLTSSERTAIAKKGAQARWKKKA